MNSVKSSGTHFLYQHVAAETAAAAQYVVHEQQASSPQQARSFPPVAQCLTDTHNVDDAVIASCYFSITVSVLGSV